MPVPLLFSVEVSDLLHVSSTFAEQGDADSTEEGSGAAIQSSDFALLLFSIGVPTRTT